MLRYVPAYFSNPNLEDALIQELRIRMHSELYTWLQYCLHRVERMEDNEGNVWGWYKSNIGEDKEHQIAPDSKVESIMFFEVTGVDYSEHPGTLSKYSVSVYCWLNKSKLTTVNEDVTLNYCDKVLAVLRKYFRVENISRVTKRDNVFDFSALQTKEYKPIMGKFAGFRINCDIYHDDHVCYNITHIMNTIPQVIEVNFTSANVVDDVATLTHTGNSTRISDVTVEAPDGKILQLLAEPKALTLTTVEFGISVGAGTYKARITILPMLI